MIRIQLPQAEADPLEKLFQPAKDRKLRDRLQKTGKSKTRRLQEAFAAHLRHVGRVRSSLCYFQAVRDKVKSMLEPRKKVLPHSR